MSSYWYIVFIPALKIIFFAIFCISFLMLLVFLANLEEKDPPSLKLIYTCFIITLFSVIISIFIPFQSDIIKIMAIDMIVKTKGVEKIPQAAIDKINEMLEVTKKDK